MSLTARDFRNFARIAREVAARFDLAEEAARENDSRSTNASHVAALDLLETLNKLAGQREGSR